MMSIEAFISFMIGVFLLSLFSISTAAHQPSVLPINSYQQLQDVGEVLYLTGSLQDASLYADGDSLAGARFKSSLQQIAGQSPLCITAYVDDALFYSECGSNSSASNPVFSTTRTLVKKSGYSTLRLEAAYPG